MTVDLADRLRGAFATEVPTQPPADLADRVSRRVRRRWLVRTAGSTAVLVAFVGVLGIALSLAGGTELHTTDISPAGPAEPAQVLNVRSSIDWVLIGLITFVLPAGTGLLAALHPRLAPQGPRMLERRLVAGLAASWLALMTVLAVTGVALSVLYLPAGPDDWPGVLRMGHRYAATITPWVAGATALALLTAASSARGFFSHVRRFAGVAITAIIWWSWLHNTGRSLAWDRIAMGPESADDRMRGVWTALFDPQIRFALVDGIEVDQGTLRWNAAVHGGLAIGLILLATLILRGALSTRSPGPTWSRRFRRLLSRTRR
ncbi:MAG: hypothetical protein GY713_22335 [Actinomycetia bacterium]|nr:hypothetical protein [Actinomycetes bacterium]